MVSSVGKSIFSLNLNPTPLKLRLSGLLLISYLLLWNTITSGTGRSEPTLRTLPGPPHGLSTQPQICLQTRLLATRLLVPTWPSAQSCYKWHDTQPSPNNDLGETSTNRATLTMKRKRAPVMPSRPSSRAPELRSPDWIRARIHLPIACGAGTSLILPPHLAWLLHLCLLIRPVTCPESFSGRAGEVIKPEMDKC